MYHEDLNSTAEHPAVRSQIDYFATLLGPPFEAAQPLQPIAGPSRIIAAPTNPLARKPSSSSLKPSLNGAHRLSAGPPPSTADVGEAVPWYDVSEGVLEALQLDLQKGVEERVRTIAIVKDISC